MVDNRSKTITKNTIILTLRMIFVVIISLYTSRLLLQILGIEGFGIYNLIGGIIVIMSFMNGSMTLAINRFLSYELGKDNLEKTRNIFSMAVNILSIMSIIIIILAETIGLWFINTKLNIPEEKIFAANIVYQTSIIIFILQTIQIPYKSVIISHENMGLFAYLSIFEVLGKLGILYIVKALTYDSLITYSILLALVIFIIFLIHLFIASYKFNEAHYHFFWSKPIFIEITKYVSYATVGNIATVVVTQGQSILLNIFYGPALNAVRGLSIQVTSAVMNFIQNVYTAVTPQITKSYAKKDWDYFQNLIIQSSLLSYYILLLISIPLLLEIDIVLNLWLTEVPEYTNTFIRLILINSVLANLTMPSQIALYSTGNIAKFNIYTGITNMLGVVITYIIWKYIKTEPFFIIYTQIFFTLIVQIINIYLQKIQLGISYKLYLQKVIKPVVIVSFTSALLPTLAYLNIDKNIKNFFLIVGFSIITTMVSIYALGIDNETKKIIQSYIRRL